MFAALASPAHAASREIDASPIWLREARVYVASRDTTTLVVGDLLCFDNRGKEVAAGRVTQVVERGLVQATLDSGTLAGIERLDRVRVRFERPAPRAIPALRVGFPSRRRSNLLFECAPAVASDSTRPYRVEPAGANAHRLVRPADVDTAWPETLTVRFFDHAGDEEIALERGELDLAVFWPGEWSSRARAAAGGPPPLGRFERGVVAALLDGAGGADPAVCDSLFALLDRGIFQGDLVPFPADSTRPPTPSIRAPIGIDAADLVGRIVIERLLSRSFTGAARDSAILFYLDAPAADADALLRAAARRAEARARTPRIRAAAAALRTGAPGPLDEATRARAWDELQMLPLFAIHCPVVARPEARAHLDRIGADAIVNLIRCGEAGR